MRPPNMKRTQAKSMKKLSPIAGITRGLEIVGFAPDLYDEVGDKVRGAKRLEYNRVPFIIEMKQPGNPYMLHVHADILKDEHSGHLRAFVSRIVGVEDWFSRETNLINDRSGGDEFVRSAKEDAKNLLEINLAQLWKNR